jgi:hypothetical protein
MRAPYNPIPVGMVGSTERMALMTLTSLPLSLRAPAE